MSYFDDASLVMIPSGYKTSKVYSVKPTSGDGDLTFTRSNDTATRVGPDGLIEKVRTNIALYSEEFDNAYWSKALGTITANATTAPDGTLSADLFTKTSAVNTVSEIGRGTIYTTTGAHTLSIYIKPNVGNTVLLRLDSGGNSANFTFNFTTKTFTNNGANAISNYFDELPNGWFRLKVTGNVISTIWSISVCNLFSNPTNDSMYVWGAQLETGDIATDYIATTTAAVSVGPVANVPRLDYLNSSCPRLLLEPQRVNLAIFSESFDNAAWTKTGVTISANATTSPNGYANADKIVGDASGGDKTMFRAISITTGQAFTISAFFKKSEYRLAFVRAGGQTNSPYVIYNLDTEAVVATSGASSTKIEDYGNGWYRISLTLNSATGGTCAPNLSFLPDSGYTLTSLNVPQYTGDGTSGGFVWGCQLEANGAAYATSYIPTLGAAVTRGADACSKTGISSLIGQTEGTLFVEFIMPPSGTLFTHYRISGAGGLYNNSQNITITANNQIRGWSFTSTAEQAQINSGIYAEGTRVKVAYAYKANDFVLYVNGVQIGTDTSGTVPAMSELLLGSYYPDTSVNVINRTNQALLFKTRLTNAQLAELTA